MHEPPSAGTDSERELKYATTGIPSGETGEESAADRSMLDMYAQAEVIQPKTPELCAQPAFIKTQTSLCAFLGEETESKLNLKPATMVIL